MASTSPESLPPSTTRQNNFEQAVAYSLHLWPALTLAVHNGWGGASSSDKRDWFAGAIVDLFPAFAENATTQPDEPDVDDVEEVLLQVMADEFDVDVDDESAADVARVIVDARVQCALGQFGPVDALRERFCARGGASVDAMFKQAPDEETDSEWDTDGSQDEADADGGADIAMNDAPPLATVAKGKPEPQIDQDGFTMVTKKKR
ncbi:hypothetical protein L249_2762 [Ophiocordyceps polyrhachis-furcata BCC 54312]|uniref:Pre-rRNA-processing protein TSR2 n=1 Tax=Ophiocordyceps polyrhachis-furcata BCC 54312 TaxID=1330021 RepID=A0A367LQP0_9HYPO|nr:hypothetical protein L249_2762 [Ophiocordyceps polyrhachis-furcata BCC 54312]